MRTLVVYTGTVVVATASVYYLLRLVSAKRDAAVKGELAVHIICRLDGISLLPSSRSNHIPISFFPFLYHERIRATIRLIRPSRSFSF
jgi:hypothetical protein